MCGASGSTVASYTYDPYGKVLTATGTMAETNPLRYRGYYYDSETDLYYLQSRYYDPTICRFINADAYTSTGQGILGHNMFAYCMNNPVNFIDGTGDCCEGITGILDTLLELIRKIYEEYTNIISSITPISDNDYLDLSQMQHNARIIYKYLSNRGWSHNAICAVLGNMQQESTISPGRHQVKGSAFGLVQWDPASKYTDWADENGYAHNSLYGQLEYLIYSIPPAKGEWFKNKKYSDYYLPAKDFVCSDRSVEYLTLVFCYSYERPGSPHADSRIEYAKYWDEYFGG